MKEFITKYKDALGFVVRFFGVYIVLTFIYTFYINSFNNSIDGITALVAEQSEWILEFSPYHLAMVPDASEPFFKVMVNDAYVARVIEGCNSVSVLILFVTFIVAFRGSTMNTIWYAIGGVVFLYLVNLFRIVVLTIAVYKYPGYTEWLHGLVFPAIIYGAMLILWIFWVRRFAKK